MRSAGRITWIVLLLTFSVCMVTAYADDTGQSTSPSPDEPVTVDKTGPDNKADKLYYDPDLESILAVKDRSSYTFLSRLTPAEQRELFHMIKKRVDDEAGVVVSIMAIVSGFVPAFISAQFADKMEPATCARISDKVSVRKAIAIGKRLDSDFLAEVAVYQDPKKVTAVVEGFPDKKLIDITRVLFQKGQYRVVAKFSDDLSVEKLIDVSKKINDPETLIQIARYMENKDKAVKTAIALSDDYLLNFMGLLSTGNDYELAAAVGQALDAKRQVNMLNLLDPEKAARLASHYSPETITLIMGSTTGEAIEGVSDQQLMDITRILVENEQYQVVAYFSDALSIEKLTSVTEKLHDPATLIKIAQHMKNKQNVVKTALALSDSYLLEFMNQLSDSDDYELAGAVGRALDVDRQINLLNRLDPEKAARLTSHYPPDTIALIMGKSSDKTLADIACHLTPENIGNVSDALNTRDINRFIKLLSRAQLLEALPNIDMAKFQAGWHNLTPETQRILGDISQDYEPLAEVMAKIK